MKAFFEEYGFVLVSIVVVMILVGMVPVVGTAVKNQLTGVAEGLTVSLNAENPSISIQEAEESEG